jgi:hypothetical protein
MLVASSVLANLLECVLMVNRNSFIIENNNKKRKLLTPSLTHSNNPLSLSLFVIANGEAMIKTGGVLDH